jgi:hypothetical protein
MKKRKHRRRNSPIIGAAETRENSGEFFSVRDDEMRNFVNTKRQQQQQQQKQDPIYGTGIQRVASYGALQDQGTNYEGMPTMEECMDMKKEQESMES